MRYLGGSIYVCSTIRVTLSDIINYIQKWSLKNISVSNFTQTVPQEPKQTVTYMQKQVQVVSLTDNIQ